MSSCAFEFLHPCSSNTDSDTPGDVQALKYQNEQLRQEVADLKAQRQQYFVYIANLNAQLQNYKQEIANMKASFQQQLAALNARDF
jgi:predicted  nucleic acid-binding Zn-ribbon protein